MGRGLDGYLISVHWHCVVLKARERRSLPVSGGYGEGETPLPFPNRAVKPLSADGTWPARARESRSPPVLLRPRVDLEREIRGVDCVKTRNPDVRSERVIGTCSLFEVRVSNGCKQRCQRRWVLAHAVVGPGEITRALGHVERADISLEPDPARLGLADHQLLLDRRPEIGDGWEGEMSAAAPTLPRMLRIRDDAL